MSLFIWMTPNHFLIIVKSFCNHVHNDFFPMTLVNDKWMSMSLCHQSSMPYRWNTSDEKMISSILLPPHHLLVICPINIWLWFLHIGFKVIVYDYNHTYSHLGVVIIDFVVAKDIIPSSERTFENKSIITI